MFRLRTRRAQLLYKISGNSALLVLNGTSLNSMNALLALSQWNVNSACVCLGWKCATGPLAIKLWSQVRVSQKIKRKNLWNVHFRLADAHLAFDFLTCAWSQLFIERFIICNLSCPTDGFKVRFIWSRIWILKKVQCRSVYETHMRTSTKARIKKRLLTNWAMLVGRFCVYTQNCMQC